MPESVNKNPEVAQVGFKEKLAGYVETAQVYAQPYLDLPNDSFKKTVAVALALCLVGAVVVSGSAVILRPLQEWNKSKDEKVKYPGGRRALSERHGRRRGIQEY